MSLKQNEKHFFGQVNQKALIIKDGKMLLVQYPDIPHKDEKARGKWDMPGGRLNEGEDALEGFRREVREEVGVEVIVEKIAATGIFINLGNQPNFFVIYQVSLPVGAVPVVSDKTEIGECRWFTPEEIFNLPMIYSEYKEALTSILKNVS
jgi:8-oxo-dGTP diphosphatase